MWRLFNCYLSGRHEYVVSCEPGTILLRCLHCGNRSPGWSVEAKPPAVPDAHVSVLDEVRRVFRARTARAFLRAKGRLPARG